MRNVGLDEFFITLKGSHQLWLMFVDGKVWLMVWYSEPQRAPSDGELDVSSWTSPLSCYSHIMTYVYYVLCWLIVKSYNIKPQFHSLFDFNISLKWTGFQFQLKIIWILIPFQQ